jgi:NAD(P)-dependent dehydrogenase (short-subunit alcohol dehydrogenase family)
MSDGLMPGRASYPSLRGRHVLVTGGATGIGAALVEHFVDQGSRVSFIDIDDAAGRALVARLAPGAAAAPEFHPLDLREVEALEALIAQLGDRHGPVAALVNNAASDDRHRLEDVTRAYFDDRMAVNLRHQLFAAKAVAPQMRAAGGGSIINLGSITWILADGDCVCYVTAKAAVQGLTRALATELGPHRIRVNAVLPGWVMTERQLRLWVDAAAECLIDERQALPGRLMAGDIARMALWLAADDSRMCSKQAFVVDGGWI